MTRIIRQLLVLVVSLFARHRSLSLSASPQENPLSLTNNDLHAPLLGGRPRRGRKDTSSAPSSRSCSRTACRVGAVVGILCFVHCFGPTSHCFAPSVGSFGPTQHPASATVSLRAPLGVSPPPTVVENLNDGGRGGNSQLEKIFPSSHKVAAEGTGSIVASGDDRMSRESTSSLGFSRGFRLKIFSRNLETENFVKRAHFSFSKTSWRRSRNDEVFGVSKFLHKSLRGIGCSSFLRANRG